MRRVLVALGLLAGLAAFSLVVPEAAQAATKTWTGANSGNWNDAGNWSGGLPAAGDDLVFDNTGANKATGNNNLLPAGVSYNSITFNGDGYTIGGVNFGIANGITSNAALGLTNTLNMNLVITGGAVTVTNSGSTLVLGGSCSTRPPTSKRRAPARCVWRARAPTPTGD